MNNKVRNHHKSMMNRSRIEMKKADEIKSHLYRIVIESSSHGLPNVFKSQNWCIKAMWLIFLLASTAICAMSICSHFAAFYEFNVVTRIKVLHENPTNFPMVKKYFRHFYEKKNLILNF